MIRATACPRITPAFLEEAKRRLGSALFDTEMNCEFLVTAGGLFDPTALAADVRRHPGHGLGGAPGRPGSRG